MVNIEIVADKNYRFQACNTESDIWKTIAMIIPEIVFDNVPNGLITATIVETGEKSVLRLQKRGTFIKNGITYPSLYVTVNNGFYSIPEADYLDYQECYLTCVNGESNNYKFYHMIPSVRGIDVKYGRIGVKPGEMFGERSVKVPYPLYLYWIRYYEKISKGYVDQSDIYLGKKAEPKKQNPTNAGFNSNKRSAVSDALYNQLLLYAKRLVKKTLVNHNITKKQISESRKYFREMGKRKTVKGFNAQLLKLLAICPRNIRNVNDLLAQKTSDFKDIVEREEQLIKAMEAVVGGNSIPSNEVVNGFDAAKIRVFPATDKQIEEVKRHLSTNLQSKIKNGYRVIDEGKKKLFEKYLRENKIKTVKCFWHGSRNENWLSIILNGLQLNPNAVITGKMFGQGIYFAPSSEKSWGYTSYYNTRWARGSQGTAFMGLYATAYGKPYDVQSAASFNQKFLNAQRKNCVHAHAGPQLYNDEIIFYNESAMLLNYIVEFQ